MKTRYGIALFTAGIFATTGCGFETFEDTTLPTAAGDTQTTGIALTIDIQGDTDVAGFRYEIETCAGEPVAVVERELEDLTLPGGIPTFVNAPFDENSEHLFSDYFTVLDPGCYNVVAQPIRANGKKSKDCARATANNVIVKPQKTTEILLISQCEGPQVGALDVIAALQHPPVIEALVYDKFLCIGESVTICATASDPNNDPLKFYWRQMAGPKKLMKSLEVLSSGPVNGSWEECIELTPPEVGSYDVRLRVRDLLHKQTKKGTRLEPAHKDSYVQLMFPIHVADCDPIGGGPDEKKKRKKRKKRSKKYNNNFNNNVF